MHLRHTLTAVIFLMAFGVIAVTYIRLENRIKAMDVLRSPVAAGAGAALGILTGLLAVAIGFPADEAALHGMAMGIIVAAAVTLLSHPVRDQG